MKVNLMTSIFKHLVCIWVFFVCLVYNYHYTMIQYIFSKKNTEWNLKVDVWVLFASLVCLVTLHHISLGKTCECHSSFVFLSKYFMDPILLFIFLLYKNLN